MFIGQDGKNLILAPLGAKRFVSESHISLLSSEEGLFGRWSINISPLCGEAARVLDLSQRFTQS